MNKKILIVAIILLFVSAAIIAYILFKPTNTSKEAFLNMSHLSCIALDDSNSDQSNIQINAYTPTEKVLAGYSYDKSDAKEYIYSLIKERIINTFQQSSADVCLTSYEDNSQYILLEYQVRQVYYTSKENIEIYEFSVEINKSDNSIAVKSK
mgnify:CR=1 FL=1